MIILLHKPDILRWSWPFKLMSCHAGSEGMVFSLLHAGTSHFSLEQAVAHPVSPDPCGLRGRDQGLFTCPSTSSGEGDPVFPVIKGTRSTW